jgi:pilus assembly protein CpaF
MDLRSRLKRSHKPESEEAAGNREVAAVAEKRSSTVLDTISTEEKRWKPLLHQKLLKMMDLSLISSLDEMEARHQISEILQNLMGVESVTLNTIARKRVIKRIEDEILGLGPLEPLLQDHSISDILVNGHDTIFIERHGKLEHTEVRFDDNAHLLNIIDRIVSRVGRRIDESSPMVDARLKDGSRVNAIIPPLAVDAPILSSRRFSVDLLGMEDLIKLKTVTRMASKLLEAIIKTRLNVVISGGTGSGKTTTLNVLSSFIPANERIVTIEDSAELQLQQPHVVRLETRPPNIEGKGEVTQRDLVRNSLRMRPDRIVLGEVRGAEALDMLQAMNTGHDGSLTTIHANTPRDALGRVENMVAMTGLNLPVTAVRAQMVSAFDVVLQTERLEDGRRLLVSVQEINGMEGDIITMSEIYRFQRRGIDQEGNVLGEFRATGIIPKSYDRFAHYGIDIGREIFDPTLCQEEDPD